MSTYPFRKSKQIEEYIGQFMRVFAGFQVQDGVERNGDFLTKKVPVVYGNMSRIVASILNKRDFLMNQSLPIMAVSLAGIEIDLGNRKTSRHTEELTVGTPGSYASLARLSGPALNLSMELSIYTSSTTELFGLLEQILLVFNPRVAIQTSSELYDSSYITDIELTAVQPEIQYPMGLDNRVVMMTLNFTVPARLRYPQGISDGIVEQIIARVIDDTNDENVIFTDTITGDITTGDITVEVTSP